SRSRRGQAVEVQAVLAQWRTRRDSDADHRQVQAATLTTTRLHSFKLPQRPFVYDVAGVQRRSWLEQQDPTLFLGHWLMLHPTRDHDEFSLFDPFVAVAELHAKAAFDDQEQFVFVLVVMKHEFALQFIELHVLAVEFRRDVGLPVFGNVGEFFGDVDLVHAASDCPPHRKVAQKRSLGRPRPGLRGAQWEFVRRSGQNYPTSSLLTLASLGADEAS